MDCRRVAVIGAGTMGAGIAHVSSQGGFETTLYDISEEMLRKAIKNTETNLRRGVDKGKVTQLELEGALLRLKTQTDLATAVREADLVIEAVPEDMSLKCRIFTDLDKLSPADAILATNTSSLSVTEIAGATRRPDRVIGMHFFNPVHVMKLVELIRGQSTSDDTVLLAEGASRKMGKETVLVREAPGFVTSRMNALIGNEAFRMLEEGVATARDIDKAIKLGLNHPMGPFEMVDLVGLDVRLNILRYLHSTLGERFKPSPILEKLVAEGRVGKKAGKGVYEYDA